MRHKLQVKASKNNALFIFFWRSHSLHARLRSRWLAIVIRLGHDCMTTRMLGKQYMFHFIRAATSSPCAVLLLRSCWRASAIRPSHAYTTARMLGKQYMFHLILAATFAPCVVLQLRSCWRAIVIRLGRTYMTTRMLAKTMHFSSYSGGHIRSMRGFAVEVVLARHCNSTWPRLHDRQNANKN